MSEVNFTPKTKIPEKNSRKNSSTIYKHSQKPDYNKVLQDAISGYSKIEEKKYAAFGAKTFGGDPDLNSTEKHYRDKSGNILASEYIVGGKIKPHKEIHTPKGIYYDWDMDNKIDKKDPPYKYQ